jgi:hypothetical protein
MVHKRLGALAVLFVLLTFPASASMVSFLVVETGLNEEISSGRYTSLWEGGLMAAFFDAGHIVSNSPIVRLEKKPSADFSGPVEKDYNDAVSSGADFFILGFLDYRLEGARAIPVTIVLKLYRTDSRRLIYEKSFPAGTGKNLDEEYKFAQDAGRTIISHLRDR